MRRYFLCYTYWRADGQSTQGVACTEIEREKPIYGFEDVREIIALLKERGNFENVVVHSWQLFEGQPCS
jgi:hypothetical protein